MGLKGYRNNYKNNNEILYIGDVGKANTALSIHAQNIAKLFKKIGYNTVFICDYSNDAYKINNNFEYIYTNRIISIPKITFFEWFFDELTGWKYRKIIRKKVRNNTPKFIIMYGYAGEKWLIKFCKKNNIPLIVERVDWFEKSDRSRFVEREILQKAVDKTILDLDKNVNGVISISRFFEDYYNSINVPTIFIPPIFEFNKIEEISRFKSDSKIRLVYAGSVGGTKDLIAPILHAIRNINENSVVVSIDLVGPTIDQIENTTNKKGWERFGVKAYGKMNNDDAKNVIKKADFSILLRQNKRYAKAGFSTKFAESMCLGVPVICTKVGGADAFVNNMVDGVLLKDNTSEEIETTLNTLINKNEDDIYTMKRNAYAKAMSLFNIDSYTDQLKKFLDELEAEHE